VVTSVKVIGPGSSVVALAPLASADSAAVVAAVKGRMAAGAYTVTWRTMAKDGHVARGSFAFTVGAAKR
jgi:methionine-rich copper-binding protein CopC